jgi:lipopolysaccharide biosynthesis regulator YciM
MAFGIGGLLYGALIGFGIFYVIEHRPGAETPAADSAVGAPAGPMAPTQVGPTGGGGAPVAPMMREIGALKRRIEQDPRDVAALTRLANLYHDARMWQQAVGYYERALELNTGDADLMTDMGVCYQGLEQYERALELFVGAHDIDSTHWQSLYNIVIVAGFKLGQVERAQAALERLEEIEPSAPGIDRLRQTLEQVSTVADGRSS